MPLNEPYDPAERRAQIHNAKVLLRRAADVRLEWEGKHRTYQPTLFAQHTMLLAEANIHTRLAELA